MASFVPSGTAAGAAVDEKLGIACGNHSLNCGLRSATPRMRRMLFPGNRKGIYRCLQAGDADNEAVCGISVWVIRNI